MNKSSRAISAATLTATFILLASSSAAQAGGGGGCHFHGNKPAEQTTVVACATERKEALVKAGKIEAHWRAIAQDKVEQIDGKKGKEWKVTFKDPGAKDKSKETLYMYFTVAGNFLAANFTGQ